MADSTNITVRNALAANSDNTVKKEYVNRAKAVILQLVQKVGDAQNELFQQSEKLKSLAKERDSKSDYEKLSALHRRVDAALDGISSSLKKILA